MINQIKLSSGSRRVIKSQIKNVSTITAILSYLTQFPDNLPGAMQAGVTSHQADIAASLAEVS